MAIKKKFDVGILMELLDDAEEIGVFVQGHGHHVSTRVFEHEGAHWMHSFEISDSEGWMIGSNTTAVKVKPVVVSVTKWVPVSGDGP
jgi:hypothetical protein